MRCFVASDTLAELFSVSADPLWQVESPDSNLDAERQAPFAGSHSMTGVGSSAAEKFYWRPVTIAEREN